MFSKHKSETPTKSLKDYAVLMINGLMIKVLKIGLKSWMNLLSLAITVKVI